MCAELWLPGRGGNFLGDLSVAIILGRRSACRGGQLLMFGNNDDLLG